MMLLIQAAACDSLRRVHHIQIGRVQKGALYSEALRSGQGPSEYGRSDQGLAGSKWCPGEEGWI